MKGIERERKAAKMTQAELAKRIGVTQGAVSQWEGGTALPRANLVAKIAEVLGCTVDALYRE